MVVWKNRPGNPLPQPVFYYSFFSFLLLWLPLPVLQLLLQTMPRLNHIHHQFLHLLVGLDYSVTDGFFPGFISDTSVTTGVSLLVMVTVWSLSFSYYNALYSCHLPCSHTGGLLPLPHCGIPCHIHHRHKQHILYCYIPIFLQIMCNTTCLPYLLLLYFWFLVYNNKNWQSQNP